ncbi:Pex24p-domain-containing protein [Aureobasidium pullulans]|nr:Pex24p-domain-containing protein [Aureobasidium pullulans]
MTSMSDTSSTSANGGHHSAKHDKNETNNNSSNTNKPPTVAAFSPTSSHSYPQTRQRSTILVHQKSPLLLATPPQVTRALAYSHPFIVPLNKLVGLLSWTTGDAWESFLFVAAFWFTVLYGDYILRYTGPLILVTILIVGMYLRRYSPLSSTGWTGEKKKGHRRDPSDGIKHRKSLDEILSTLQTFTTRCNILLDPLLRLTDFLSTQQTATSATTQPALTTLFIRIMLTSPLWWALTLPPLRIITTKRIILVFGTIPEVEGAPDAQLTTADSPVASSTLWSKHLIADSSTLTGIYTVISVLQLLFQWANTEYRSWFKDNAVMP